MQNAANKLEDDRWEVAPKETAEYEKKLEDYGVKIIEFTDDELQNFYNKCWESVWPELTELYGGRRCGACEKSEGRSQIMLFARRNQTWVTHSVVLPIIQCL